MQAVIALIRKDLRLHFSNRRAVILSIVAPILIAAFFGSLFGGKDNKPANIPLALTDLDRSELSAQVAAELRGDATLVVTQLDEAEATAQVRAGKQRAAITLPPGFGAQAARAMFGAGDKPVIVLTYDPSQSMTLPLVRGLLAQHVMQPVSQAAFSASSPALRDLRSQVQADTRMPEERRADLLKMFESVARVTDRAATAASAASDPSGPSAASSAAAPRGGLTMPFTTQEVEASSSRPGVAYNGYAHSFAGMGVQFILLMGVDMGVGLLLMRRMGLWKRLRAAPLSRAQLLGSRVVSCALIASIVFAIVYACAIAFFGVRISGSGIGFVAVLAAFALMTGAFGLMIAALGRSPEATRGLAILVTLLLVMLGGAWVPSFIFPPWLQAVSAWTPTYWAVSGLDAMTWRGQPLAAAAAPVAALLAYAAVFAALALWRFEWEE